MTADLILAIDAGTQSTRALLFDLGGTLIAMKRIPIEPYYSAQPGWAEQDAEVYWKALCDACQGLWKMKGVDNKRIAGVAVTTQRSTLINLDQNGKPLRPAIVWLDQRRTEGLKPIGGLWGAAFQSGRHDRNRRLSAGGSRGQLDQHPPAGYLGTTPTSSCCCRVT